jgi:hypothetical protein
MRSDEAAKKTDKDCLGGFEADFYAPGVQKPFIRYKCLNLHGDYTKKLFKDRSNDVKNVINLFFNHKQSSLSGRYCHKSLEVQA